jgi:two-component system response regulator FixJ
MTKKPIYLVEPDDVVRDSLKVLLESNGFAVEAFATAVSLRGRGIGRAGCLVLGFDHHGKGGLDLIGACDDSGSRLPVVFVVGRSDPAARAAAIHAGAFAYLERPVKESLLVYTIRGALEARRNAPATRP